MASLPSAQDLPLFSSLHQLGTGLDPLHRIFDAALQAQRTVLSAPLLQQIPRQLVVDRGPHSRHVGQIVDELAAGLQLAEDGEHVVPDEGVRPGVDALVLDRRVQKRCDVEKGNVLDVDGVAYSCCVSGCGFLLTHNSKRPATCSLEEEDKKGGRQAKEKGKKQRWSLTSFHQFSCFGVAGIQPEKPRVGGRVLLPMEHWPKDGEGQNGIRLEMRLLLLNELPYGLLRLDLARHVGDHGTVRVVRRRSPGHGHGGVVPALGVDVEWRLGERQGRGGDGRREDEALDRRLVGGHLEEIFHARDRLRDHIVRIRVPGGDGGDVSDPVDSADRSDERPLRRHILDGGQFEQALGRFGPEQVVDEPFRFLCVPDRAAHAISSCEELLGQMRRDESIDARDQDQASFGKGCAGGHFSFWFAQQ